MSRPKLHPFLVLMCMYKGAVLLYGYIRTLQYRPHAHYTWYPSVLTDLLSIPHTLLHHLCPYLMEKKITDNPHLSIRLLWFN